MDARGAHFYQYDSIYRNILADCIRIVNCFFEKYEQYVKKVLLIFEILSENAVTKTIFAPLYQFLKKPDVENRLRDTLKSFIKTVFYKTYP